MIFALTLCLAAATLLGWLTLTLAIYALPVLVGTLLGWVAHGSGAGLIGAAFDALAGGALVYAVGHVAIERSRSPALRLGILAVYVTPAAIAGFAVVHGLAEHVVPSSVWQSAFATFGGVVVAASAWARMTVGAPPGGPGEVRGTHMAQP